VTISLKDEKKIINMEKTPIWKKTIFAQFENPKLKNELIDWAEEQQLNMVWGDPKQPDLIACPSFALVIDRNLIIENGIYSQYLEYIDDVNIDDVNMDDGIKEIRDTSICILIDNIKGIEIPSLDLVLQVDIQKKNAIKWILHNIELASKLTAETSD